MSSRNDSNHVADPLDAVVANFLQNLEAGATPDRDALLAAHPDLAERLRSFFADLDNLDEKVTAFRLPDVALPEDFGDYEFLDEIGRGGMGVVYRARQKSLGRVVALKMILSGPLAGADAARRFRDEAETVAKLDHPHVVPVYEVGEHAGIPFFTMRLIEGHSLTKCRSRYLDDPKTSVELLIKVCSAVHHAHQRGVLHRDLKPGNILVDEAGEPHVTDFGLSKRVEDSRALTATSAILGTPEYMAPEQAAGTKDLTTAVDVYGLGAIVYTMLTGRPPYWRNGVYPTLRAVIEDEPTRPSIVRTGVPRDLEVICLKCLAKEPDRRYPSALALGEDLGRWLRGEPIVARRVGRIERYRMWARRKPLAANLLKVSVLSSLLIVGGLIVFGWQMSRSNSRINQAERKIENITTEHTDDVARREADRLRLEHDLWLSRRRTTGQTLEQVATVFNRDPQAALELLNNFELCPIDQRDAAWRYYESGARAHARPTEPGAIVAWGPDFSHFWGVRPGPHQPHKGHLWALVSVRPDGNTRLLDYSLPDIAKWPLQVVDLLSGEVRGSLPDDVGCRDLEGSVAISLDGSTVVWRDKRDDEKLIAWDVDDRKCYEQTIEDYDLSIRTPPVLSPDGRHVLVPLSAMTTKEGRFTEKNRPARLIDVRTGNEGYQIPEELTPVSANRAFLDYTSIAPVFSPDGRYLAYWMVRGDKSTAIQVIDLEAQKPLATLPAAMGDVDRLYWDPLAQRYSESMNTKKGLCPDLMFSPDSKYLLRIEREPDPEHLGSYFLSVHALDGSLTRQARHPLGRERVVVRFSPDGRYVGVGAAKGIQVIATSTWEVKHTLPSGSSNFVFDVDGKRVVCSEVRTVNLQRRGYDPAPLLRAWDLATGEVRDLRRGEFGTLIGLSRRDEVRSVLTAYRHRPFVISDFKPRETGQTIALAWSNGASQGRVSLRQAPDPKTLLIDYSMLCDEDGKSPDGEPWEDFAKSRSNLRLEKRTDQLDLESGAVTSGKTHSEKVTYAIPDWQRVEKSSSSRHIDIHGDEWKLNRPADATTQLFTLWLVNQRTGEQRLHGIDSSGKRNLGTSPDGNTVVLGTFAGEVELWDVWTGQRRVVLAGHSSRVLQAHWMENSARLATADEQGTVRLWDFRGPLPCLGVGFRGTEFTPNGQHLASWTQEAGIEFVSLKTGLNEPLPGASWKPDPEQRFRGETILRFTSDGRFLVRGESDRFRVIEVASGKTVAKVRFRADGKRIEYEERGNDYGNEAIRVWTVAPDGTFVAFGRAHLLNAEKEERELQMWRLNIADGSSQMLNRIPIDRFALSSFHLEVTSDSKTLVLNQGAKRWKWFDANTGELTRETELDIWTRDPHDWQTALHPPRIGAVPRIHPGGHLALSRDDRGPFIWDFAIGKERWRPAPTGWSDLSGDFSPDGRLLAIGDERGIVTVSEAETGKAVATYNIRDVVVAQGKVTYLNVSFDPTSSRAAALVSLEGESRTFPQPGRMIVWDLRSGKSLAPLAR